jgi:ADP-ribose pyrophosphatase YjhB (NUDIX family)
MIDEKLVYSGKLFRIYTWNQEMFDGSFEIFERAVRKPSVQMLVISEGKIMIFNEQQPGKGKYLSLPGGMVEWEESLLEGAERELLEETGMTGDFEFLEQIDFGTNLKWKTGYFIVRNPVKVKEPELDSGEIIESRFVSFDEFYELTQTNDFRNTYFSEKLKMKKLEGSLNEFKSYLGVD